MNPISNSPGWITHKPHTPTPAATKTPAFAIQLQAAGQSLPATGPSRANTGPLHAGGMNDSALHMLALARAR